MNFFKKRREDGSIDTDPRPHIDVIGHNDADLVRIANGFAKDREDDEKRYAKALDDAVKAIEFLDSKGYSNDVIYDTLAKFHYPYVVRKEAFKIFNDKKGGNDE